VDTQVVDGIVDFKRGSPDSAAMARPILALALAAAARGAAAARTVDVGGEAVSALFLRLHDPALITANGQRTFEIADVVADPRAYDAVRATLDGGNLAVAWADGANSTFDAEWLAAHAAKPPPAAPAPEPWNARFAPLLPRVDAAAPGAALDASAALVAHGVALLGNASSAEEVAALLGHVRATNYGATFGVRDAGARATNLAYTPVARPASRARGAAGTARARARRSRSGQDKRAKFPTSKARISAVFHSFPLIFGRAIISRNGLEA